MKEAKFNNDISLINGCVERDLDAWSRFIKKYSGLVMTAIDDRLKGYGFSLPSQDLEDIGQEVFTTIWQSRKLEGLKNIDSLSYWLAMISGNEAAEYVRKMHRREPVKAISIFDDMNEKELIEPLISKDPEAGSEISKHELKNRVSTALDSLPRREKLIMELYLFHDKKYRDIADILSLPKGTVACCINRSKEKLRDALKNYK
ncbi:MAG: sigma-70 family RNA polymerase sigma factor [Candidatus Omnitrophota bacterium]|jgi:RNA polymerase sigma-70 factor (ECF subfamily)